MAIKRRVRSGRLIITCDVCGKEYWGQRATAQYCSNGCKQAAYRKRKEAQEAAKKLQLPLF